MVSRFCGSLLNVFSVSTGEHPVYTCAQPFLLHFHCQSTGNAGNSRGFNLHFPQLPCRAY